MSILIVGYYNYGNLGDDMFMEAFPLFLKHTRAKLLFERISNITLTYKVPDDLLCVILGGGDVFNDYFMKYIYILKRLTSVPFHAVGVGISYESYLVDSHCLSMFETVYTRNAKDIDMLSNMIGYDNSYSMPDLGYYLNKPSIYPQPQISTNICACFFATPAIIELDYIQQCIEVINKYQFTHNVVLYRFNSSNDTGEDDSVINIMLHTKFPFITMDNTVYTTTEMMEKISVASVTICTRFHAHVFAKICDKNIISIAYTRKVELLMASDTTQNKRLLELTALSFNPGKVRNRYNITCKYGLIIVSIIKYVEELTGNKYEDVSVLSSYHAELVGKYICKLITGKYNSDYEYGCIENCKSNIQQLRGMVDWMIKN
jgi:exopolysaccharide biosynthesis predicted pyruvyltransferase EpsI